ncbi:MAG: hypothetical protein IJB86_03090, partial [Clostridia bacterium]|nr:hypothetical protein [Clostridia bacterium]
MNNKNNGKKFNIKKLAAIVPYILIPAILLLGLSYYSGRVEKDKTEYYEIVQYFDEGKITEYTLNLSSGALQYTRINEEGKEVKEQFSVPNVSMFINDVGETVRTHNRENPDNLIEDKYKTGSTGSVLINILPTALLV